MSNSFCIKNPEKNREIVEQISENNFPFLDGLRILVVDDNDLQNSCASYDQNN